MFSVNAGGGAQKRVGCRTRSHCRTMSLVASSGAFGGHDTRVRARPRFNVNHKNPPIRTSTTKQFAVI